jgi:hypothetical protein
VIDAAHTQGSLVSAPAWLAQFLVLLGTRIEL